MLVGRSRELGKLVELLGRVGRGHGAAALLIGEAGIGKTSLATTFVESVPATVLWGACLEDGSTFGPWRMALSAIADTALTSVLAPLVPSLLARPDLFPPVPLEPREAQLRLFEATVQLLREVSRDRALVIVLDDIHWIDRDSAALLRHVLGCLHREPWLLVVTGRPSREAAERFAEIARVPDHLILELRGLAAEDVGAVVAAALGREAPDVAKRIHDETSGVPFYVRELLAAMNDERVPTSIQNALASRLARLNARTRQLLDLIAVLSQPADVKVLVACTQSTIHDTIACLEEAALAGMIRTTPSGYALGHALFRRAILEAMLPDRRALLHAAVAETLEAIHGDDAADEIATQWHAARSLAMNRGARHARIAAEAAERAAAHERAALFWQMTLDLSEARVSADFVRLALADAAALRFDDARRAAESAIAAGAGAHDVYLVARAMKHGGAEPPAWEPLVERGMALAPEGVERARLEAMIDRVKPVAAGPWYASCRVSPDPDVVAILRATGSDSDLAATVSPFDCRSREETEALAARAAQMTAGGDKIDVLDAVIRDDIHRHAEYRRARRAAASMLEESQRIGHLPGEAEACYELAKCDAILGAIDSARKHAERVPPLVARLGAAHRLRFTSLAALHFEIAYFSGGDWSGIAAEAVRFARDPRCGSTPLGLIAMGFGALAAALDGQRSIAVDICTAFPSIVQRFDERAYQRKGAIDLAATAVWHLRLAERATIYRDLELRASAEEGTAPITCTDLCLARMAALAGDRRETQRRYERARAWAEEREASPLAAIATYEHGLAGGARRGMLAARSEVERALDEFRRLSMSTWIADAEAALGATRSLPDGLTMREAEILALVATGLSNKDIAARVRISPATVQRHLANAYAKIGATTRTQATAYVLRLGLVDMAGTRSA